MALGAIRAPELTTGPRVVRNDDFCSCRDHLDAGRRAHDERRRPAPSGGPRLPPHLAAVRPIERDDERAIAHFLIALQDEQVLEDDGRRARAHSRLGDPAKGFLPEQFAVEIERVQPGGFEERVDGLAISRHRRRGVGVLAVTVVVHQPVVNRAVPQRLAVPGIEREHLEGVEMIRADAVGVVVAGLEIEPEVNRRLVVGWRLAAFD